MSLAAAGPDGAERATFRRYERIRKRRQYLAVYDQGIRRHTEHFTVIVHRNPLGIRRFGISVGRHTGGAAKRNRVKRLLREFFRLHKALFPASSDVVIIAKRKPIPPAYRSVEQELVAVWDAQKRG